MSKLFYVVRQQQIRTTNFSKKFVYINVGFGGCFLPKISRTMDGNKGFSNNNLDGVIQIISLSN